MEGDLGSSSSDTCPSIMAHTHDNEQSSELFRDSQRQTDNDRVDDDTEFQDTHANYSS